MGQKNVRAADRHLVSSRSAPGALRDDIKNGCVQGCVVACSRRSDSRAREKNSRRKKKRGETRGFPPPRFPGVQLNSLPTYRRALSERLEQASCVAD